MKLLKKKNLLYIKAYYKKSNNILKEKYNLPVDKYDYPL